MKSVPEAKNWWRMFSVQAMMLAGALQGAWAFIPLEMQETIPEAWLRGLTIVLLVLGVVGRLVYQPKVHDDK